MFELKLLPPEVIVEIFKFSISNLKFIFALTQVCKNWKMALENDEFGFYNFVYNSLFVLKNIKPNLLQITKKDFEDKKNFITNRPLLYKTGIYYFEIQSLKDQSTKDNLFVGFLLRDKNHLYNTNHNNHLGFRDDNSFGLFFCNGDMYGFNKNNVNRYANGQKYCSWVYLNTNNLKVRFVLIENKKIFKVIKLVEFYTKEQLENYCNGQLALFPAVSILYGDDVMELIHCWI